MNEIRRLMTLLEKLYTDHAAKIHPDDPMSPTMMVEPKVLFRSVSIPELADIWLRGDIQGGKSDFNSFEHRSYVFFGDTFNAELISQGEEIARQVSHGLKDHQAHRSMRALGTEIADQKRLLGHMLRDQASYRYSLPNDDLISRAADGDWSGRIEIKQLLKPRALAAMRELDDLLDQRAQLRTVYQGAYEKEYPKTENRVAAYSFSSAVLQTRPVDGGVEYPTNSGMTQQEYGFQPGEITVHDIAKVFWIKNSKIVGESGPDDIGVRLKQAGFYA